MSSSFSFEFQDEDIEYDGDAPDEREDLDREGLCRTVSIQMNEPEVLLLEDLISLLPSKISYNAFSISLKNARQAVLARRELFDIRAQMMAEDDGIDGRLVTGLSTDDITPKVYEGGFKTWECSLDLAEYLDAHMQDMLYTETGIRHIIELGAGTALPTTLLLHHLLRASEHFPVQSTSITLTDFNGSVLSLATLPNILLTYALYANQIPPISGDLDIDDRLLSCFSDCLKSHHIKLQFISGDWCRSLVSRALPNILDGSGDCLILASETIYSPSTTRAFTETLLGLMQRIEACGGKTKALVAAKKVYFGVGGGINGFLNELRKQGGSGKVVWETTGTGTGVGRCIVEVHRVSAVPGFPVMSD